MKLTISGDAFTLTSSIKAEDIMLLKQNNPDELRIKDDEGNDKFAVSYVEGKPHIAEYGITFSGKSRDGNNYATITGDIPAGLTTADAAKNFIADKFGGVVAYLEKLEESIPKAVTKVNEARKKLLDSITIQ